MMNLSQENPHEVLQVITNLVNYCSVLNIMVTTINTFCAELMNDNKWLLVLTTM